jgi:hypothetical protein
MTCGRSNAGVAAAAAALLAAIGLGAQSPGSAAEARNEAVTDVPAGDTLRSEVLAATSEAWTRRTASGTVVLPALAHVRSPAERSDSGCSGFSSGLCAKAERIGSVPPADTGSQAQGARKARLDPVLTGPSPGTAPYKVTTLAPPSEPLPLATPESATRVPAVAIAATPPGGSSQVSFGSGGVSANEETAPGPYAILLIGLCLVAFMAVRRIPF